MSWLGYETVYCPLIILMKLKKKAERERERERQRNITNSRKGKELRRRE